MELSPGILLDGTVRSIADFGAFIDLPGGRRGLVHISEISGTYVKDIRQHLREGQAVKVKVLSIDERGRIALSTKQAQPSAPSAPAPAAPAAQPAPRQTEPQSFEDKLKHFMADSNSKLSGVRSYEHKTRTRRR